MGRVYIYICRLVDEVIMSAEVSRTFALTFKCQSVCVIDYMMGIFIQNH